MSYSGSNWSRYSSPFSFSDNRSSTLSSYSQHRPNTNTSNVTNYANSIKSHPSTGYASRGSSSSSMGSGYSSSGGGSYLMGHYAASPVTSSSSGRDRDFRSVDRDYRSSDRDYHRNNTLSSSNSTRSSGSGGGSLLPSQYSRYGTHQRTYSGSFDRKPARPSSLYENRRSLRSYDSEYTQTPAESNAVVHQFTIRPNTTEAERNKDSSVNKSKILGRVDDKDKGADHRDSTCSVKNVVSKPTYVSNSRELRKEKKGFLGLKKRLSASLNSLVSSLGSLSYSAQDLSTSSADINMVPSQASSAGKYHHLSNNDEDDDETEYSDSVSSQSQNPSNVNGRHINRNECSEERHE